MGGVGGSQAHHQRAVTILAARLGPTIRTPAGRRRNSGPACNVLTNAPGLPLRWSARTEAYGATAGRAERLVEHLLLATQDASPTKRVSTSLALRTVGPMVYGMKPASWRMLKVIASRTLCGALAKEVGEDFTERDAGQSL
jgi:hypothetical protein